MVSTSRILTVSYGTFSCTLEGFDEPFTTMKAISEYFRDLAADDRYFGAEPPTPDAEMLHRIAEKEIHKRVEARIENNEVVLRQTGAAAPRIKPAAATLIPGETLLSDSTPKDTPAPVEHAAKDMTGEEQPTVAPSVVSAEEADSPTPPVVDTAPEPTPAPVAEQPAPDTQPPHVAPPGDSIAAKLQLIRAAVERSHMVSRGEDTEDLDTPSLDTAFFNADPLSDSAPIADQTEAPAATVEQEDLEDQLLPENTVEAAADPALEDDSVAHDESARDDEGEAAQVEDAETSDADALVSEKEAMSAKDSAQGATLDNDDSDNVAFDEEFTEDLEEDLAEALPDLPIADAEDGIETRADENDPTTAETEMETAEALLDSTDTDDALQDDAVAEDADTDQDVALSDDLDDDAPEDRAAEEDDEENVFAADATAEEDSAQEPARRPIARVIKVKRVDVATREPEVQDNENSMLSPEDEADLIAELAAVEAEFTSDPAVDTPDEKGSADQVESAKDASEQEVAVSGFADSDAAVERILAETNVQMDKSDVSRRRSAIAHLKAAVQATRAEVEADVGDANPAHDQTEAYRDDLARVVRPRRPESAGKGNKPRLAPLMLVSEQRIDEPAPEQKADATPVRPRRVTRDRKTSDARDEGRAGARQQAQHVQAEPSPASPASPPQSPHAGQSTDFDAFAREMEASDMEDLLEAAAAHAVFVEGRPHFSRPQVLKLALGHDPDARHTREEGLRAFGKLLRQGRIHKIKRGQFVLDKATRFRPVSPSEGQRESA